MNINAFTYALAAGFIPSLLWLFFFTREEDGRKKTSEHDRWLLHRRRNSRN